MAPSYQRKAKMAIRVEPAAPQANTAGADQADFRFSTSMSMARNAVTFACRNRAAG